MEDVRQVPIIVLGLGQVGRSLLRQVLDTQEVVSRRSGLDLRIIGVADSTSVLLEAGGLPVDVLASALDAKNAGLSLNTIDGGQAHDAISEYLNPNVITVDVTASRQTKQLLENARTNGCGIVLANKIPLSRSWCDVQSLFEYPYLRYEATVGAGLPAIAALHTLSNAGDRITAIEGCMSGTLGYLCSEIERGVPYSEAVSQARALGYSEPDPREDLSGQDVARKTLILARTAGWPLEQSDLSVEPLYHDALCQVSLDEFIGTLSILDEAYSQRDTEAKGSGRVLRYVARVGPDGGSVGLTAVKRQKLLAALRGPVNYIAFHSERYAQEPLVIAGPGAGAEVTAAGVLGDIVNLANRMGAQTSRHMERKAE
jgi:homoserine dehydrogenase